MLNALSAARFSSGEYVEEEGMRENEVGRWLNRKEVAGVMLVVEYECVCAHVCGVRCVCARVCMRACV